MNKRKRNASNILLGSVGQCMQNYWGSTRTYSRSNLFRDLCNARSLSMTCKDLHRTINIAEIANMRTPQSSRNGNWSRQLTAAKIYDPFSRVNIIFVSVHTNADDPVWKVDGIAYVTQTRSQWYIAVMDGSSLLDLRLWKNCGYTPITFILKHKKTISGVWLTHAAIRIKNKGDATFYGGSGMNFDYGNNFWYVANR